MAEAFDLERYLTQGVENILADILRATLKNPRQSAALVRFAAAARHADKVRVRYAQDGEHIPPFLIASITSRCNLHCEGCYSRCNQQTTDTVPTGQLTGEQWGKVFQEARDLGISFILLAGGEPMLRPDVLTAASQVPEILFPIFTNGTCMDKELAERLDQCRNLVPVLSIEGGRETTDGRRGPGVYDRLVKTMETLTERSIMFGASVTVTRENLQEVLSKDFLEGLASRGCRAMVFVEYVPVTPDSEKLAPGEEEREILRKRLRELRASWPEMLLVSFPGDELESGGCLAAGRGFFHINSHGGAEPCPFSPYTDTNVLNGLRHALSSPLFQALRQGGVLEEAHTGGCVLFSQKEKVEAILAHGNEVV